MRKSVIVNLALVAAIVLIIVAALMMDARRPGEQERFVGSDSAATSLIEEQDPNYVPWFSAVFAPTSGEVESGLFALQAAIGGIALGYCVGALRHRRRDEFTGTQPGKD
ncbi:energy-coupling factor ABC transporter substrate-binding protein [Rhodococcus erythropolis]|uniref:energy-coupling factor ABC transporter substrate-binding protein n=1 Tax=Rhodococcus TaxID=1827 RepID=UPI0007DB2C0F|nr:MULTISPECIES: energy-coupling factor ABC transporter substrate-binding protein [Rhodococcus]MDJ0407171.1 energy-coupling factor ABC transporter substrate-binding protein [Rhodococcus erythropolis]